MKAINKLLNNKGVLVSFKDFSDEYYSYHKGKWTNYFDQAKDSLTNLLAKAVVNSVSKRSLIQSLIINIKKIVSASPDEIPQLITRFSTGRFQDLLYDANGQTDLGKEVEKAFNYKAYRNSSKISWFSERFGQKTCLYCNAQFALVVGEDGVKKNLLFQFDHFYSQKRYPYLSLTLGNLVPSCSTCNNSKSNANFTYRTHIHPFIEDASSKFVFSINQENALEYLIGKRDEKLIAPELKIIDSRFSEHDRIFKLTHIYRKHTDIIEEIILKSVYYNETRRKEIQKEFESLNISKSLIERFILGNYCLDSEINNRPLSKLSKDIAKQLKIIT